MLSNTRLGYLAGENSVNALSSRINSLTFSVGMVIDEIPASFTVIVEAFSKPVPSNDSSFAPVMLNTVTYSVGS